MPVIRVFRLAVLGASLLLGFGLGHAGAAPESEPNDSLGTAGHVALGDSTTGDCSGGPDFISFDLVADTLYAASLDYTWLYNHVVRLDLFDTNGVLFLTNTSTRTFTVNFVAVASGPHAASFTCLQEGSTWRVTVTGAGPAPIIEGPAEREHNDYAGAATRINGSGNFTGVGWPDIDPVDYWYVPFDGPGGAWIHLISSGSTAANLATIQPYSGALQPAGDQMIVAGVPGSPFTFAVQITGGGGNYTLGVETAADVSVFYEGPDEVEPNNVWANATPIDGSQPFTLSGVLGHDHDLHDFYAFTVSSPSLVTIRLSFEVPCDLDCPAVGVLHANGSAIPFGPYPAGPGEKLTFPAPGKSGWIIEVASRNPGGPYLLNISMAPSRHANGSTLGVAEANSSHAISVFFGTTGKRFPGNWVNIGWGGNGILFGECLEAYVENNEPVDLNIRFPAGLRLVPWDAEIIPFVLTRDVVVLVPAATSVTAPLQGAAESTKGKAPAGLFLLDMVGMATGSELRIVRETAGGNYSAIAEIIALWASLEGMDRATLREWSAPDDGIAEAGLLLRAANVASPITAPPPSPPRSAGASAPQSSGLSPLAIGVGALLGLIVLAAVVGTWRNRTRPARWTPPSAHAGAPAPAPAPQATAMPGPGLVVASLAPAASNVPMQGPAKVPCPRCETPVAVGAAGCSACFLDLVWN